MMTVAAGRCTKNAKNLLRGTRARSCTVPASCETTISKTDFATSTAISVWSFMMGSSSCVRCSDFGTSMPTKSPEESISSIRLVLRGHPTFVAMVQATDFGNGNNLARRRRLNRSGFRWIFPERQMRAGSVVGRHVAANDPQQVAFIDGDHVIKALAA